MQFIPDKPIRTESNAEKKLFKSLKEANLPDSWYCLHSLSLSNHITKREGEIDFLIITDEGIFVIEVKGGQVRREGGLWHFTNRFNVTTTKRESPFEQAKTAMYSLRDSIVSAKGMAYRDVVFGYGVALPDIPFDVQSPEWDLKTVFSKENGNHLKEYIEELSRYWSGRQRIKKSLTRKERVELVHYLRGTFNLVRPLADSIQELEDEFIKLTEEQTRCLDALNDNQRVWISGSAGTGKTMLAYEQARRNQKNGVRTLFLCYNKFLSAFLRHLYLTEYPEAEHYIEFYTVHGFMSAMVERATGQGIPESIQRDTAFFNSYLPQSFMSIVDKCTPYDFLIIDEAQDVMMEQYIEPLGKIISGGWQQGTWSIFLDPENQKNIFAELDQTVVDSLKEYAAKYKLTQNCRNTKNIAIQAEVLTGLDCGSVSALAGMQVKFVWYDNDFEQAVKVTDEINKLLDSGVSANDVVILSDKKAGTSLASSGRLRTKALLKEYQLGASNIDPKSQAIRYTTIPAYKGLESPVIVMTDVMRMEDDWHILLNYVAATRARSHLIISMHKDLKKAYTVKVTSSSSTAAKEKL